MGDEAGHAAYRLCRGLVRVPADDEDSIYLARLPGGPIHVLTGPAALILDTALRLQVSAIVPHVAEQAGASEADIETDVRDFMADLESSGLIERTDQSARGQLRR